MWCTSPPLRLYQILVHSQIRTKKRNRLLHDGMRDLVFVKFHSKLRNKKQNKDRDPIEKDVEDVQADNDNEFITGAVYVPSEHAEPEPQHGASHGQESASQAQGKRKRPVHRRKKKLGAWSLWYIKFLCSLEFLEPCHLTQKMVMVTLKCILLILISLLAPLILMSRNSVEYTVETGFCCVVSWRLIWTLCCSFANSPGQEQCSCGQVSCIYALWNAYVVKCSLSCNDYWIC